MQKVILWWEIVTNNNAKKLHMTIHMKSEIICLSKWLVILAIDHQYRELLLFCEATIM